RRRHRIFSRDWSSDVCSSDLIDQREKIESFMSEYNWRQRAGLLFAFLIVAFQAGAMQDQIKLTPFTGVDFVRLVVDETFRQAPENTFNVKIRSLDDNSTLWQGDVDFVLIEDKGKPTLSCTISD